MADRLVVKILPYGDMEILISSDKYEQGMKTITLSYSSYVSEHVRTLVGILTAIAPQLEVSVEKQYAETREIKAKDWLRGKDA